MSGANIGDLLNSKGVTWGWFADGFRLPNKTSSSSSSDIKVSCDSRPEHLGSDGKVSKDYYPDENHFNTTSQQPILCICLLPQIQLSVIIAIKPIINMIY